MKSIAVIILIVVLTAVFLHPLIETSNLLKEKIILDSAILNSCRSARNNSLVYDSLSNLQGFIDADVFKEQFSIAFAESLELTPLDLTGSRLSFTSPSARWDRIDVRIDVELIPDDLFEGRGKSIASVSVETPYVFRTSLLKAAVGEIGQDFKIKQERRFVVQVIN
jgi:hypothetical protein